MWSSVPPQFQQGLVYEHQWDTISFCGEFWKFCYELTQLEHEIQLNQSLQIKLKLGAGAGAAGGGAAGGSWCDSTNIETSYTQH